MEGDVKVDTSNDEREKQRWREIMMGRDIRVMRDLREEIDLKLVKVEKSKGREII